MSNGSGSAKNAILSAMGKPILRVILSAAAVIFTLNLLFFNYSRHVILPLLGALLAAGRAHRPGGRAGRLARDPRPPGPGKGRPGPDGGHGLFLPGRLFQGAEPLAVFFFLPFPWRSSSRRFFIPAGQASRPGKPADFFSRPPAEYAVFLVPLAYAALPPTFYDSLVYHLGIPNLYLQSGGFIPTPQFVYANTFIYYEISLIPAVFLGDMVPRLFHFLLGTLFVLAVADEAVEHWGVKSKAHADPGPGLAAHDPVPPGHLQERPGRRHFHFSGHLPIPAGRLEAVGRCSGALPWASSTSTCCRWRFSCWSRSGPGRKADLKKRLLTGPDRVCWPFRRCWSRTCASPATRFFLSCTEVFPSGVLGRRPFPALAG